MGNKKAREYLREKELKDSWQKAISEPRNLNEDVHIRGIGIRILNIKYIASFEDKYLWDIRLIDDRFEIYQSKIDFDGNRIFALGYEKLEITSKTLRQYFDVLKEASFPIAPLLDKGLGIDGTEFELIFSGSLNSEIAFRWWSTWPQQWACIVEPTFELIETILGFKIDHGTCA
jgi:hypothetical protein